MTFKIVFAALTAACMLYFLVLTKRTAAQRLFVLGFFGAGLLFILQPDLANALAHSVGIGRGADLILYLSTLFLIFLSLNFYIRFRALEDAIVVIARDIAVRHPVRREGDAGKS